MVNSNLRYDSQTQFVPIQHLPHIHPLMNRPVIVGKTVKFVSSALTALNDVPSDVMRHIFSFLPPSTPEACYKATCKGFSIYYRETIISQASLLQN
jgi:hypothetical protein